MTPEDVERMILDYGISAYADGNYGDAVDRKIDTIMSAICEVFAERDARQAALEKLEPLIKQAQEERDALQARLEAAERITKGDTIDWQKVGAIAKNYASSAPKHCRAAIEAGFQQGYTTGCSDSAIAQEQGKQNGP